MPTVSAQPDLTRLAAGDIVVVRWDPTNTKRAVFRRWNKASNPVLGVERVDRKGRPTGEFGSDRVFTRSDIVRVEDDDERTTQLEAGPRGAR